MPTDLQASTSSTSSLYKQCSIEDTYSLDKSHDEMNLSKKLSESHLNNGFFNIQHCCVPLGLNCIFQDDSLEYSSVDRCEVVCSNTECDQSGWIHGPCRTIWEQKIKTDAIKLNVQTRASIDRQRGIGPWMDVLQTAIPISFLCPCNNGTLTTVDKTLSPGIVDTEISYFAGLSNSTQRKMGFKIQTKNPTLSNHLLDERRKMNSAEGNSPKSTAKLRSRTLSDNQVLLTFTTDSSGKNPNDFPRTKKDANTPRQQARSKLPNGLVAHKTKPGNRQRRHSSNYHGSNSMSKDSSGLSDRPTLNSKGNIFVQRRDLSCFQKLPFSKQNAYFIQMEDDSCTGNDDTKVFLLSLLSQHGVNSLQCLICSSELPIYDHLPLVDGTFFLSPLCHSASHSIAIPSSNNPPGTLGFSMTNIATSLPLEKYLHVICMHCMHEIVICCQFCHRPWTGAQLLIGSLYTYDIFAAAPCCIDRLSCNNCSRLCVDIASSTPESASSKTTIPSLSTLLNNFSQLSRQIECRSCHCRDYHFVKPFADIYKPIGSYM